MADSEEAQEPVGPGWVPRDISEIKPGAFQAMRSLENQFDSLRQEDVRDKATTDPMYKYYKRLLPKPRYRTGHEMSMNVRLHSQYMQRSRVPRKISAATEGRGL